MYKIGLNWIKFFATIFQFAPGTRQSEIVTGQSGLNKKKGKNITNVIY